MNRKLLALAVGAAMALPLAAQAAPSFYGKLDVSTEYLDGDRAAADVSEVTLESNKSRLGVRGEEKLSNQLSVVYQVEYGVTIDGDSANSPDLNPRDRFLGLRHSTLGTLQLGRMDTPLKDAEANVDVFNNSRLDMENVFAGQERESNSIAYTSPAIADAITARLTLITEEGGTGAGQSAALAYDQGGLYLALAMDNDVVSNSDDGVLNSPPGSFYGAAGEADTVRLVAGLDFDGLRLGALLQQSEGEGAGPQPEQTGWLLSAAYTLQQWTFKGEVAGSEAEVGAVDLGEIMQVAVGADYQWTQTFKTYGFLGRFDYDSAGAGGDAELTLLGVGMSLSF